MHARRGMVNRDIDAGIFFGFLSDSNVIAKLR